jgi:hypothetical protein
MKGLPLLTILNKIREKFYVHEAKATQKKNNTQPLKEDCLAIVTFVELYGALLCV